MREYVVEMMINGKWLPAPIQDKRRFLGEFGKDAAEIMAKSVCVVADMEYSSVPVAEKNVSFEARTVGNVNRRPRDSFEKNIFRRYGWLDSSLPARVRVVKVR